MSHICSFCPFRTNSENEYTIHGRICIPSWKHKLTDSSIPITNGMMVQALCSCFCIIEKQNTTIQELKTELTRVKPYISRRQKKHHDTIMKRIHCSRDINTWLREIKIPSPFSIQTLLENGIKYIAQTILKQHIEKWPIPLIDVEPAENILVDCPLFMFPDNQTRVYVYRKDDGWSELTDAFLTSIISFIYASISNDCLTQLNQTQTASATHPNLVMDVMEILNQDPPHKSLTAHKQFLRHCLLQQIPPHETT